MNNTHASSASLSEDEAALYDRQIRLWGLDSQRRLRAARVLLVGMSGLAGEIVKNVALAGVNQLTLMDDRAVTSEDLETNFLLPESKHGENRAIAAVDRTQALNPMVTVTSHDRIPDLKDDTLLDRLVADYDVIICAPEPWQRDALDLLTAFDSATRRAGSVQFFGAQVFGFQGFAFVDLQEHNYCAEEVKTRPKEESGRESLYEAEKVMVKKHMSFCPMEEALSLDWSVDGMQLKAKKTPKLFFLMQALAEFSTLEGRCPRPDEASALESVWTCLAREKAINPALLNVEDFRLCCGRALPAVNAIMGGLVSQEVIKAISHKEPPLGNFVFFSGGESCASVDLITKATLAV